MRSASLRRLRCASDSSDDNDDAIPIARRDYSAA